MEIIGRIEHIQKRVDKNKTLFNIQTTNPNVIRDSNNQVICKAYKSALHTMMPVKITGEWDNGVFDVESIEFQWLDFKSSLDYMVAKSKNTGIGRKTAQKILEKYGKEFFIMDKDLMYQSLMKDFSELNEKIIYQFILQWFAEASIQKLEAELLPYDIPYKTIESIDDKYGSKAIDEIRKNPYKIGIEFDINYKLIDAYSKNQDINPFDERRIEGLVSYYLINRANNGHTYATAVNVAKGVSLMSNKSCYAIKVPEILVSNIVTTSKFFKFDEEKKYIAFKKYYNAEINIANKMKILNTSESVILVTDDDINQIEKELNFTFGAEQRSAFKLLEQGGICILTGGPGCGKTTLVNGIVRLYKKKNPGAIVKFAAPTGAASKRLSISTKYKARTVHKLLEFSPFHDDGATRNAANPLEADFIIIDETSMLGVLLMSLLIDAVPEGCRILFVGDEDQLPSVEAGNCLHDIIKSDLFPTYRLTENFRQKGNGSIIDNSKRVLKGERPVETDDFELINAESDIDGYEILCRLMLRYYRIDNPLETQLMEPSKKGHAGTFKMNQFVHQKIVHAALDNPSEDPMIGDKIMFLRNQYISKEEGESEELYVNGDIGVITALTDKHVWFDDGFDERILPINSLLDADFAYSYTIHKSQGNEANNVIIYLPDSMKHMMNRSLLYTAITRARQKVIIVYTQNALEDCLNTITGNRRDTRLLERLLE